MRKLLNFFLAFLLFNILGCDFLKKQDDRATIINRANFDIRYLFSISYPDTNMFEPFSCHINNIADNLGANQSKVLWSRRNWEDLFAMNGKGIVMLVVYKKDDFSYYWNLTGNCDSILKRKDLIMRRYDLSMDYFAQNDWTVVYP